MFSEKSDKYCCIIDKHEWKIIICGNVFKPQAFVVIMDKRKYFIFSRG
jgi:hypothetical protein